MHPILRDRRLALAFIAFAALAIISTVFLFSPQIGFLSLAALPFLGAVMPEAEFQQKVLDGVDAHGREIARIKDVQNEFARQSARRLGQLEPRKPGTVNEDCAEFLTAVAVKAADRRGRLSDLDPTIRAAVTSRADQALNIIGRAALTTADIALPVAYGSQIAELIAESSAGRRWGTVMPMGTGAVSMPRRKTAPTFGLIAMSATVTEKSPQIENVTFTALKFGGLCRLPNEISGDSFVPIGQWIASYMAQELAACEDRLFFIADGTATYGGQSGLVKQIIDLGGDHVHALTDGNTSPVNITLSDYRLVRTKVSSGALGRAAYYLHRSMETQLFGFNTGGTTVYQTSGKEPTLDGFPCRFVEVLPAYSNGASYPEQGQVIFGDLRFHWLGTVGGVRIDVSNDAFFDTDEIAIRGTERIATGLMADDALAVLQLAEA